MSGIPNIDLSGFGLGQQQTSLPWNRTRIRDMPGATPGNPTARPDFTGAGSFNRMAFGGTQFGIPRPNPYGSFFSTPQFGGSFDTFGSTTGGAFDRGVRGNGSLYSFGQYNYGNPQGGFGSGQGGPLYRAPQWNSFSGGYHPGGANISPPPPVSYNPPPTPTVGGVDPTTPAAPTPAAPTPSVPSPPFVPTTPGFSPTPTPTPTPIVQPNFPSFGPSFGPFMPPVSDPFIRFM